MNSQPEYGRCRRAAIRIPMPFELQLTVKQRTVDAIIRDVSPDNEKPRGFIGIGLLHADPLPLHTPLPCVCLSRTTVLSRHSEVTLVWTRHFGADGYLSGGKMVRITSENEPHHKPESNSSSNQTTGAQV